MSVWTQVILPRCKYVLMLSATLLLKVWHGLTGLHIKLSNIKHKFHLSFISFCNNYPKPSNSVFFRVLIFFLSIHDKRQKQDYTTPNNSAIIPLWFKHLLLGKWCGLERNSTHINIFWTTGGKITSFST